jgi:DNA-binding XRE family transcriptional regulator
MVQQGRYTVMKGARKFSGYLREQLKDEEFKKSFEEEDIYADLAIEIARLRNERGLSQGDLARLLNTTQQNVSRLENPHNKSFSIMTLIKLARAFHKNVRIQFV